MRVFTHPACSGCASAVKVAWEISKKYPKIQLRTVNLENKEGLAEAHAVGIRSIPTTIVSLRGQELRRWIGTPPVAEVAASLDEISLEPEGSSTHGTATVRR